MQLHLINGFLGSGKTTGIIAAAKYLMQQGKTVGIVTNDKGRFQVDAAFFQASQIPTRQVTGGCFRCSFSEFEDLILQLQESDSPDVILAESVGSCVDLVNTVFDPIQKNSRLNVDQTTYTVFTDLRLFEIWIQDEALPFSDNLNYLFGKQIEESRLLILNKSDLVSFEQQQEILALTARRFPQKNILVQNSLESGGVLSWLAALEQESSGLDRPGFAVDYSKYKAGEQEMAWLDATLTIESESPANIKPAATAMIEQLVRALQGGRVAVGHLKFFFCDSEAGAKLSFTTADFLKDPLRRDWAGAIPEASGSTLAIMLNGRAAMRAKEFSELLDHAIARTPLPAETRIRRLKGHYFNPVLSLDRPPAR